MSAVNLPKGTLYQGKYNIYDPDHVEFKPRLDFLQTFTGVMPVQQAIEDVMIKLYYDVYHQDPTELNLSQLAYNYKEMQGMGARLPKFSKWLTNMFVGNKQVQEAVAKAGQHQNQTIVISTDKVDILRSGDSPHFHSCYNIGAGMLQYSKMPVRIAEEAPGVALAYVDDPDGKMRGRVWLQAVEMPDRSKAVMLRTALGNISINNVVASLQSRGADVVISNGYAPAGLTMNPVFENAKLLGGFAKPENFDFYGAQHSVRRILPLQ